MPELISQSPACQVGVCCVVIARQRFLPRTTERNTMTIAPQRLASMAECMTSHAGVGAVLSKLASVKSSDGQSLPSKVSLPNDGNIGVNQFRKLPAPLAEAVARVTDNEQIIRHIHEKDRRLGTRKALAHNEHLPQDVMEEIVQNPKHPAYGPSVRTRLEPLSALCAGTTPGHPVISAQRVLREGTDEQVQDWVRYAVSPLRTASIEELTWEDLVRMFPHVDDSELSSFVQASMNVDGRVIDWSDDIWDRLLERIGTATSWAAFPTRKFPFASDAAPISWLKKVLRTVDKGGFREFALTMVEPAALSDEDLLQSLSGAEHFTMLQNHYAAQQRPFTGSMFDKVIAEQDPKTASDILDSMVGRISRHSISGMSQETAEKLVLLALEAPTHDYPYGGGGSSKISAAFSLAHGYLGEPSESFIPKISKVFCELISQSTILKSIGGRSHPLQKPADLRRCSSQFRNCFLKAATGPAGRGEPQPAVAARIPEMLIVEFEQRSPDADEAQWDFLLTLLDEWNDSLTDLLDVVEATA